MAQTVSIPKKEYEILIKCRKIVHSEFEERFSKKFIKEVEASEESYKKGKFLQFDNVKDAKKYFERSF